MGSLVSKRWLDILLKTILCCGLFHVGMVIVYALWTQQYNLLNVFNFLQLGLLFPGLVQGSFNMILSFFFLGGLYVVVWCVDKRKS